MKKKEFSYDLLEISNRCINRDVKEEIFEKNSEKAEKKAYCESEKYKLENKKNNKNRVNKKYYNVVNKKIISDKRIVVTSLMAGAASLLNAESAETVKPSGYTVNYNKNTGTDEKTDKKSNFENVKNVLISQNLNKTGAIDTEKSDRIKVRPATKEDNIRFSFNAKFDMMLSKRNSKNESENSINTSNTGSTFTSPVNTGASSGIGASSTPSAQTTRVINQQILIPIYKYPHSNDPYWQQVTNMGGSKIPYVVLNPSSGPGTAVDANYVRQISSNINSGIKNIAYVATGYQSKSAADIIADLDKYGNLYGMNNFSGVFLDEMASGTDANARYMENVYKSIKSKYPNLMVVGNPGKSITDSIAPYSDIFVTKEVSASTYLNNYRAPSSAFENNPANANRIMHIIYGATPAQYDEIIRLSRERNVGWLYIVNDTNYNNLPTNFSSLVDNINTPLVVPVLSQNSNKLMTRVASPSTLSTQTPLEAPRSKVNLDLVKNIKSSIFQNLQNTEEGKTDIDFTYIGNFSTDYKDKKNSVEYDSDSRGILISIMKNFGKFTVGGGLGYQDSKVNYKGNFEGIDEKIKSHQFILSGKYEFNDNIDLTNVLTYSGNSHKFKTETGAGLMNDVKYKSQILDYTTKLGYKFFIDNGYVKPYIGLAAIRVSEGKMDKLDISESTKSGLEWLLGVYAEKTIGQFDIFGKAEYGLRAKKDSYHGKRNYGNYKIAPLSYSRGVFNVELGTNYRINDYVKASLGYGLADSKNSSIKLGLEASF